MGGGGNSLTGSSGGEGASGGSGSGSGGGPTSSGGSSGTGSSGGMSSGGSSGTTPMSATDGGGTAEGGGGADASVGGNCMAADFSKPCGSFTTPTGTNIQLGPYGAVTDPNVGKGFENTVQSSDQGTQPSAACQTFANLFMENANLTNLLLTTTMNGVTTDFSLYTVYRPAVWPDKPVPVITWGNGTCAQPEGYGALLRYVASYGYFVVAANDRQVGTNDTTGTGSTQPMLRALDYAAAANMDSTSPYYQKLDMTKVGAMGHSQGGSATVTRRERQPRQGHHHLQRLRLGVQALPGHLGGHGHHGIHRLGHDAWPSTTRRCRRPSSSITTPREPRPTRSRGTSSSCCRPSA